MEKLEYIDNVINLIVKVNLINSLEDDINELREEECFDEDIYEYINKVVLTMLHTKYGNILKKLKDS